jgi:hypothetical protein
MVLRVVERFKNPINSTKRTVPDALRVFEIIA